MTEIIKDSASSQPLVHGFLMFEYDDVKTAKSSDGLVEMQGIIQAAGKPNANNRVYPREIGELDHPDSPIIQLENVSHLVTETHWNGNDLVGTIEVLDTPKGNILSKLIDRKIKLGISSRGLGSTSRGQGGYDVVEEDFGLICYDMVSNPSTSGAFMNLKESVEYNILINQNKNILLDDLLNDILGL
jgi:hypothetical protein